jgi:hypothetical protein
VQTCNCKARGIWSMGDSHQTIGMIGGVNSTIGTSPCSKGESSASESEC